MKFSYKPMLFFLNMLKETPHMNHIVRRAKRFFNSYNPNLGSVFEDSTRIFLSNDMNEIVNKGFLENENQLISRSSVDKIRHIPAKIIQGRYDIVCPMETAWELSKNWPEAELIVAPSSGHSAFEKEITHELIKANEEFAKNG